MNAIDLVFAVTGTSLATDHGYALYGAMSRFLPCLHDGSVRFGFLPITGTYVGRGLLQIDPRQSRLRLRVQLGDVPRVLPLAGKRLDVMGHAVRLGVAHVEALRPASALIARTVAIKTKCDEESPGVENFVKSARQQLTDLGIEGTLRVPERMDATGQVTPLRRIVRVKGVRIVCYPVLVGDLKPEESLRLQEEGIGGRRRLGCGLFVPARSQEAAHAV